MKSIDRSYMKNICFEKISDRNTISDLEKEWRNSLTFPNDDYWEAMLDSCKYWVIKQSNKESDEMIGFAFVSDNNVLLQYFVSAQWLDKGLLILEKFIKEKEIKKAWLGTNNPIFQSQAMHFQKSVEVTSYLFADMVDVSLEEKDGNFRMAESKDLEQLVDFSHRVLDAPKDWLTNYIDNWINREEFFLLEKDGKIIGTSEARTTPINGDVASLGIVVCPEHRNQGIGSYLMGKAKTIAKSRNQQAICSCAKDNTSSLKAIERNGFRILHLGLRINFMENNETNEKDEANEKKDDQ